MPSAVIVRAQLPPALERLRRAGVADLALGVPAHLTLLYPFIEPGGLEPAVRGTLVDVASRHPSFGYRLRGAASWPDTLYVAVTPPGPFVGLQHDLQVAFPEFPIYGRDATFLFVPHVTIAEGPGTGDPAVRADPAWRALPRSTRATAIEVIARGDGRWRLVWRIPLADRMRP